METASMDNIWGQFYMPKGGNLDESIMFSSNTADRRLFFSAIHPLVEFFFTELPFCTHILLRLMYLWV